MKKSGGAGDDTAGRARAATHGRRRRRRRRSAGRRSARPPCRRVLAQCRPLALEPEAGRRRRRRPRTQPSGRSSTGASTRTPRLAWRHARAAARAGRASPQARTRPDRASSPRQGASGGTCHHDIPASASQSTKRYASASIRPDGRESGEAESLRRGLHRVTPLRRQPFRAPRPKSGQTPSRILIQDVRPQVDCGRYPVKAIVGDGVRVTGTIIRDGHEVLGATVRYGSGGDALEGAAARRRQRSVRGLVPTGLLWDVVLSDRGLGRPGCVIPVGARRKVDAGQEDLTSELAEGALLLGTETLTVDEALAASSKDRHEKTWSDTYKVDVDRERAAFGAWYELFPRSWGGFKGVERMLPPLAELGFDVVYLPPVAPIGHEPEGRTTRWSRRGRARRPVGDRRRRGRSRGGRNSGRSRSSSGWSPAAARSAARSASTSRSSARPTTRG